MEKLSTEEIKNLVMLLSHGYVSSFANDANPGLIIVRNLWYKFRDELKNRLPAEEFEPWIAEVKKMCIDIANIPAGEMDKLIQKDVVGAFAEGTSKISD